jgi:predicted dehydrogenase
LNETSFAVVGIGGFGLKGINSILPSKEAKLVYIVDVNRELAKDVSKKFSVDAISFDELLSKKDYDVAIIATPNVFHEELFIKLLKQGKDVWCEKPMTLSIQHIGCL